MATRFPFMILLAGAVLLGAVAPAHAQQTINFTLGYFTVRGEDARVADDVLVEDRNVLAFDIGDFNGPSLGVEWLVPLGNYIEAGAGVSFSRRTVPSLYRGFVNRDQTEIEQDLRLRLIPVAFTFRVVPTGISSPIQPYLGAGLGIIGWRYSETGEFVDTDTVPRTIFRDTYVASGSQSGPVALGGIRFAGDSVTAGFEVRYQSADAALGERFRHAGPDARIDLGGWTYQMTLGYRFGQ